MERHSNSIAVDVFTPKTYGNEKKKTVVEKCGMSFMMALFIVLLALKLSNVIAWSWWWVTAPLWIPFVAMLGILAVVLMLVGLAVLRAALR